MKMRTRKNLIALLLAAACWCGRIALAQDAGTPVAQAKIDELKSALTARKDESSAARKRLELIRAIRDGSELLEANPSALNRFEILGILFDAQRRLLGMENTLRNREGLLEICRQLAKAPDKYAELRLEADLLLNQTELARQGATAQARVAALKPMVARYRGTPADAKMLRIAMVMALELGDTRLIGDLQEEMAERFAGNLEMIAFQREKLGGQVFGAPFCGTFKRSDGTLALFPADGMGRSTALYFWSKSEEGLKDLELLATAWKEKGNEMGGRLSIVSLNVDELPDAGEKMLRDHGVDWQALHLPGGRKNPLYTTFAQRDPAIITLSPSGYAALIMSGTARKPPVDKEDRIYTRWLGSSLARDWTKPRYVNQLASLLAGDFLVTDPVEFDPSLPPEVKALSSKATEKPARLHRTPASVPEETLRAIQSCFPAPPLRYRMPFEEMRASYEKAEALCAQAIAAHAKAPDLWIVRNRHIIALLGLSKLTADHTYYQRAVAQAKAALDSTMPTGTEVVARFCLAHETLRGPAVDSKEVIGNFLKSMGGENAPGPALAAAALLALDVGNRGMHEEYRKTILAHQIENPMMWTFVSFLLDRHHRYQLFKAPFSAGWSFGRRENYFLSRGQPDEVQRTISAELQTLDGKPFRIPQDTLGKWTVVLFIAPWADNKKSPLSGILKSLTAYAESRPSGDFQTLVAFVDDHAESISTLLKDKPLGCPTLLVPKGIANPLVQQLGIISEDESPNALILRPDGSMAAFLSGFSMQGKSASSIPNVVDWQDQQSVNAALERGDIEEAKRIAFTFAPPDDVQEPVDPKKKKKTKKPVISLVHLQSRARVYMAMKDWDAALKDAEQVVQLQTSTDGSMSLRTDELDEAEAFRDSILQQQKEAKK